MEILRTDKEIFVPLRIFVAFFKATVIISKKQGLIQTPLGDVIIEQEDLHLIGDIHYVSKTFIEERLMTPTVFDLANFALRFDLPWQPGSSRIVAQEELKPEVLAPGNTISAMRLEAGYTKRAGNETLPTSALFTGRLSKGAWRLRYDYELETGSRNFPEYSWYNAYGNTLVQVGNQQLRLHPLLGGFEMTGAQLGRTNRDISTARQYGAARELLPRNALPSRTFTGTAPPGGLAQLWIDGHLVGEQLIGFDGRYLFLDVPLASRQINLIEVKIYDRDQFQIPLRVEQLTLTSAEFLLPAGVTTQLAGAGWGGNIAGQAVGGEVDRDDVVGFYQWRMGLNESVTLEATAQKTADDPQFLAGTIVRLSDNWVSSLALAGASGDFGYGFDLEGFYDKWRILAQSKYIPAAVRASSPLFQPTMDIYDHSLNLRYRYSPQLELELLGRLREDDAGRVDYLLPAITWRPGSAFYLRARPDSRGTYRYELFRQFGRNKRLFVNIQKTARLDFHYRFHPRYDLNIGGEFDDNDMERVSAIFTRLRGKLTGPNLRAGVIVNEGSIGYLAGGSMQVIPGMFARAEYRSLPLTTLGNLAGVEEEEFTLQITTDLAFSGRSVRPANHTNQRRDHGSISGRIHVIDPGGQQEYALGNIEILIEGQRTVRTDRWGNFYIGNLSQAVYRVSLLETNLPIELTTKKGTYNVQVIPGANSSVRFEVVPLFGMAGRVIDHTGLPLPEIRVVLEDKNGKTIQSARSDRFGLFRMDGLPNGRYILRIPVQGKLIPDLVLPSREVTIRDQFLFDIYLKLPEPGEEPPQE